MRPTRLAAAASIASIVVMACGGGEPAPASTSPRPDANRVDAATAGRVAGQVQFDGQPPGNPAIKMASDPVCLRENQDGATLETVVVTDGGLENVFVYLKDGLGGYAFDAPTQPVRLDQKGCRYMPHVFGVQVGQPIEISNSDATFHNVHAMPNVNREFNVGQPLQGMKNVKTFTAREVMVPFKCDVHGWMHAYAGVLDHPYFAVTSGGGRFELRNVPPGTYTIEAWHEKLGARTQSVTLGEKESREISFTFAQAGTHP
jgi:plastocyanin